MIAPMRRCTPLLVLAVLAISVAVRAGGQAVARPWAIVQLDSPAGAQSAQPQLSSSDRGLILSWVERDGTTAVLKFADKTESGWSPPRTVASGSDWFVNWADVPSVVRLAGGDLAAHWLQKSGPDPYAYDVRVAYSKDDGRTWSRAITPHTDGTKTEHGFASLFQMAGAGLGLVWLDGRAMGAASHGHAAGAMSLRSAAFGRDWRQTAESSIDPRVCECCPTAAAVTSEGPIVAFRNRGEDEVRDIYTSRLENGSWSEPRPIHADGWKIAACPVNGPALSARGREVAIAWFTAEADRPRALVAFSQDAGRTFGSPIRLDDGAPLGRTDVDLLPDGSAMASWIEVVDRRSELRLRRVDRSGAKSPAVTVAALAGGRASGYPRVAAHAGGVVVAWTDAAGAGSRVRTAAATSSRPSASRSSRR